MRATLFSPLFAWVLAMPCLAQSSEPQAVFKRLQDYAGSNALDFQTTFDARSETVGTVRGSVHFLIQRPNFFRIEGTAGHTTFVLVSDGQTMTIYNPNGFSWKLNPALSSEAFKFVPPDGSKMVQEVSALGLQPPE
jgi:outer membrane lipoprotein-sorting protein